MSLRYLTAEAIFDNEKKIKLIEGLGNDFLTIYTGHMPRDVMDILVKTYENKIKDIVNKIKNKDPRTLDKYKGLLKSYPNTDGTLPQKVVDSNVGKCIIKALSKLVADGIFAGDSNYKNFLMGYPITSGIVSQKVMDVIVEEIESRLKVYKNNSQIPKDSTTKKNLIGAGMPKILAENSFKPIGKWKLSKLNHENEILKERVRKFYELNTSSLPDAEKKIVKGLGLDPNAMKEIIKALSAFYAIDSNQNPINVKKNVDKINKSGIGLHNVSTEYLSIHYYNLDTLKILLTNGMNPRLCPNSFIYFIKNNNFEALKLFIKDHKMEMRSFLISRLFITFKGTILDSKKKNIINLILDNSKESDILDSIHLVKGDAFIDILFKKYKFSNILSHLIKKKFFETAFRFINKAKISETKKKELIELTKKFFDGRDDYS